MRSYTFGVIYALRGHQVFTSTGGPSLTVLDTRSFEASILQEVSLINTTGGDEMSLRLALTHDGRSVLVAQGQGAVVLNVGKLSVCDLNAIEGNLIGPGGLPPSM